MLPLRCFLSAALVAALVLPATHTSLQAQDGARALSLEDYYEVLSLGSVGISPNGELLTYSVSHPREDTNDNRVESWVIRATGDGEPERILHDGEDVTAPSWHEDGRLRYRHGGSTWILDLDDPRSRPEPWEAPEGHPSPDGHWVVHLREMPLTPPESPDFTPFEARHQERFQGDDFDWYPFKRDGEAFPLSDPFARPTEELFLSSPASDDEPVQLTRLGQNPSGLQWSPANDALLFTVNEEARNELRYGASDLFIASVHGELTRLTDDSYNYSGARFSPDGRQIAYVRSFGTDMIIDQGLDHGGGRDLWVHPLDGSEPTNLTRDWDLDAGTPQWSPDGAWLYFTTGIGGATHLFRVAVDGGPVEQVTTGDRRIQGLDIAANFQRMAYTVGEFDRPADLWVANIDGSGERRLTDLHADFLAKVEVATEPSRAVHWESFDGTPIEGFLVFPHDYDPEGGPYPLIIMNHGGPHAASGYGFNFKNQLFSAHGYFVFLPNFRASTGYGTDFKWATWGAWGTKDGEDVISGVDYLVEHFPVDPERVGSTGHSYGGILTNWLITRYPERIRAAVSGAGESNWTSNYALSDVARTKDTEFFGPPWEPRAREIMIRQSPYLNCGGARTPTLFVHGAEDYRVPLTGSIQLYTCLKRQGVDSRLIIYEGMAHGIRGHWNSVHRMMHELRWWEEYLKPLPETRVDGG
jgi:dipeptidyl aminopeptidase/acylaminoacyl peptidase